LEGLKMLYSEFLEGTGAAEGAKTFEQYRALEKIYADCDGVSKGDVYAMWAATYGRQIAIDRKRVAREVEALSKCREVGGRKDPQREAVKRKLFAIGQRLQRVVSWAGGAAASYTDGDGVKYVAAYDGSVNGHARRYVYIVHAGRRYDTALIWQFGQWRLLSPLEWQSVRDVREAAQAAWVSYLSEAAQMQAAGA
jgi:hypothetical protein